MYIEENNTPIYLQIKDRIIHKIETGELMPGDRLWSENDLAIKLSVSRLTVRKAYAELANSGILTAIRGKGTYISEIAEFTRKIERKNESLTIGIMFPESEFFYAEILKELESLTNKNGHSIRLLLNSQFDVEEHVIQQLIDARVDGIIISPFRTHHSNEWPHYELLNKSGIPYILIGKPPIKVTCDSIYANDLNGAYQSTELLIHHGNKDVVHISNSGGDPITVDEFQQGYNEAMNSYGYESYSKTIDIKNSDWPTQLKKLFDSPTPPTAFFCESNFSASSLSYILQSMGIRIPEDCEIIGYDIGSMPAHLAGGFSALSIPKKQMAKIAYSTLLNKINGSDLYRSQNYNRHAIVNPILNLRESTRA